MVVVVAAVAAVAAAGVGMPREQSRARDPARELSKKSEDIRGLQSC
jgi:hypothetical protein